MPFELKDPLFTENEEKSWSLKGPEWLDRAKLPFDSATVREIHSPGYWDRNVPISGELKDWHETVFPAK